LPILEIFIFGFIEWASLLVPDGSFYFIFKSTNYELDFSFLVLSKHLKIVLMIQTIKMLEITKKMATTFKAAL